MSSWAERIRQAFSDRESAQRQAEIQAEAVRARMSSEEAERLERERRKKLEGEEEMRRKLSTLQEIGAEGLLRRTREVWGDGDIRTSYVWNDIGHCVNPVAVLESKVKGDIVVNYWGRDPGGDDAMEERSMIRDGYQKNFLGIESRGNRNLAIIDAQGFFRTDKAWWPSSSPDNFDRSFIERVVNGHPNSEHYDKILGRIELNESDVNVLRDKAEQAILGFCVSRIESGNLPKESRR